MAYYAWSVFPGKASVGDSVTADKLGVDKDEFDAMVESGAIREEKYPEAAMNSGLSPAEEAKKQLAIQAGNIEPDQVEGAGVKEKSKEN